MRDTGGCYGVQGIAPEFQKYMNDICVQADTPGQEDFWETYWLCAAILLAMD